MKLNYNNKYKERLPLDTIEIIQKFFNQNNFNIKVVELQENNSSTWSAHLELYFKDIYILSSNGKGINKDYCLASGYAELYERFCNKIFSLPNYISNKKITNISYNKNNFYYSPKEKKISFEDSFQSKIGQYFLLHMGNNKDQLKDFFSILFDQTFIGVPYINPSNNEAIYLDPRFIIMLNNSSGMAAGNNFYEAFNQGVSEIYEHIIHSQYHKNNQDKYFAINLSNITNPTLKTIIQKIQENNQLYIIDLSYNFHVPVLMSLIVNKYTHAITINFGAFPVLDIAIERILTELYQGIQNQNNMKLNGQIPFNDSLEPNLWEVRWPGCTMTRPIFPEFIINKLQIIDHFNFDVFLTGQEYSNKDIYDYILKLNKEINLQVFYHNVSLSKDMYAIQIFTPDISYLLDDFSFADSIPDKTNYILFLLKLFSFIEEYTDKKVNESLLNELISINSYFLKPFERYYLTLLQGRKNQFILSKGLSSSQNILEFMEKINNNDKSLFKENSDIPKFIKDNAPQFYDRLINYIIIQRYLNKIEMYDIDELINIFNFLQLKYSIKDIKECCNNQSKNYWLEKIFLHELNNFNNDNYIEYFHKMAELYWVE